MVADTPLSFVITAIDHASQVFGNVDQAITTTSDTAQSRGSQMADNLTKASAVIVASGAAAAGGLFAIGSTFDDVADTIRVGTGATGKDLDGLIGVAKNVGKTVPVEFDKIGPVVADLNTRLGLTGPPLEALSAQFLNLGNILGQDVDIPTATKALAQFEREGIPAGDAMDRLFQISQATGVGFNELTGGIEKYGFSMTQLGFSSMDAAAVIGNLDKAGIDAEGVMNLFSKGLATAAKNGEDGAATFKRVTGEVGSLIAQGKNAEAIDMAGKLFGTKGAVKFVEAVNTGKLAVDDLSKVTGLSGDTINGAAADTADFAEQWQLFKNNALVTLEPIATRVFGLVGNFMAWINTSAVPWLTKYKDIFIPLAYVIGGVAGAIVVATGAIKAWEFATRIWTTVQTIATGVTWALNAAMSANPAVLITLAIVALIAILVVLWTKSETFRDVVTNAFNAVLGVVQTVFGWVRDNWPLILAILTGPIGIAVAVIVGYWDSIKGGFDAVADWIGRRVDTVVGFFTAFPERIGDIWSGLKSGAIAAFNWVADKWNGSLGKFGVHSPSIFGKSVDWDMPKMPKVALARGGITTGPIAAVIGDNPSGTEAIIPLERFPELFGTGGGGGTVIQVTVHGFVGDEASLVRKFMDALRKAQRQGYQFA